MREKCGILIFSKDRAMQLELSINSFLRHVKDLNSVFLNVLYFCSSEEDKKQYDFLKRLYPDVNFVSQESFNEDVVRLISSYHFILMQVDDNIWCNDFEIKKSVTILENSPTIIGFSYRLGLNTTYCYMRGHVQSPRDYLMKDGYVECDWRLCNGDFGYPLEISATMYRVDDILPWIKKIMPSNPNKMEGALNRIRVNFETARFMIAFNIKSSVFSNPINLTQNGSNVVSKSVSVSLSDLRNKFKDFKIDASQFDGVEVNSCHFEIDYKYVRR